MSSAPQMTKREFWKRCQYDLVFFSRRCLMIRVLHEGRWCLRPLEFRPAQLQVAHYIQDCIRRKAPVRIIIDKCRQLGMSTVIEAALFWLCSFNEFIRAQVVAHLQKSTNRIADICRIYARNLPKMTHQQIQPRIVANRLEWGQVDSILEAVTQGSTEATRGDTPSALHISELGLWDRMRSQSSAEDVLQASLSPIDEVFGTLVVIESTSGGASGAFFDRYRAAEENYGKPGALWKPFFFGWQGVPKYTLDTDKLTRRAHSQMMHAWRKGQINKAKAGANKLGYSQLWFERAIEYSLTPGEMGWAIQTLRTKYNGDIHRFDQEFPLSWQLSFVAGGSCAFDQSVISRWMQSQPPPETRIGGKLVMGELPRIQKAADFPVNGKVLAFSWHPIQPYIAYATDKGEAGVLEFSENSSTFEQIWKGECSEKTHSIQWDQTGNWLQVTTRFGEHKGTSVLKVFETGVLEWLPPNSESCIEDLLGTSNRDRMVAYRWVAAKSTEIALDPSGDGWELYRFPDAGHHYLVGVDTAEGLGDGDFSCIRVFDRTAREVVAEYYERTPPRELGVQAMLAAKYYNEGLIVPEVNNHGHSTLQSILDTGYRKIYRRNQIREVAHGENWMDRLGFRTTPKTRPTAINRLAEAIRTESYTEHSRRFLHECTSFVRHGNGKRSALKGAHDDAVMAMAFVMYADKAVPRKQAPVEESPLRKNARKRAKRRSRRRDPHLGVIW